MKISKKNNSIMKQEINDCVQLVRLKRSSVTSVTSIRTNA